MLLTQSISGDDLQREVNLITKKHYSYIYEKKYLKYKAKYIALKQKLSTQ